MIKKIVNLKIKHHKILFKNTKCLIVNQIEPITSLNHKFIYTILQINALMIKQLILTIKNSELMIKYFNKKMKNLNKMMKTLKLMMKNITMRKK